MADTYRAAIEASYIPSILQFSAAAVCLASIVLAVAAVYASSPRQLKIGRLNHLAVCFFLVAWILPVFYLGIAREPLPGFQKLRARHNISSLFVTHWDRWAIYYPQIKLEGESRWLTIPQEDYFDHGAFGDLNRFLLYMWYCVGNTKEDVERRHYMLRWFGERYQELHPNAPKPVAARLLWTTYKPELGKPPKIEPWSRPAIESVQPNSLFVLDTIELNISSEFKKGQDQ